MAPIDRKLKAVVTGIHGFTGTYVAEELRRLSFEVYGTSHKNEPTGDRVSRVDLTVADEVSAFINEIQPNVVIHLAAISFVAHEDVSEIYEMNIVGTRNLLHSLTELNEKPVSVVLASSANIYGNSSDEPITEVTKAEPTNDYAVSKFAMEKMARIWTGTLPITVVRPFNYTGRGQSTNFLVPKLVHHFKNCLPEIDLGNLEISRDFSDVRTVAWVYGQLALKPAPGEVFNICSGRATSLKSVMDKLALLTGHNILVNNSAGLSRAGEVNSLRGDASKLWAHIGKPKPISLDETLAWMLAE